MKKLSRVLLVFVLLCCSGLAVADPITEVWTCTLNDGKTAEDAHAVGKLWLDFARKITGNDDITSTFATPIVGDYEGFLWVEFGSPTRTNLGTGNMY